jgi:hypothetical protein
MMRLRCDPLRERVTRRYLPGIPLAAAESENQMPKKLAVGARKAAMKGKKSASKRELIEAGETKAASQADAAVETKIKKRDV